MKKSPNTPRVSVDVGCPFDGDQCTYPCSKLVPAKCQAELLDKDVALQLGVSRTTWYRYRNGQQKPPRSVCFFLRTMTGWLPWSGWEKSFINQREQKLYVNDYKDGMSIQDLQSYWWQIQELAGYRRERTLERTRITERCGNVLPFVLRT
jgi:hypothetical protein